jgi:hypothetical protein
METDCGKRREEEEDIEGRLVADAQPVIRRMQKITSLQGQLDRPRSAAGHQSQSCSLRLALH